eukprot:GCRY01003662.1.p1 GENE.GCRY01003662.1~~GCRY01003662.1.p1  ORF type:complete len:1147 (-),score=247.42 GCRY01003662.1:176-3616(-)
METKSLKLGSSSDWDNSRNCASLAKEKRELVDHYLDDVTHKRTNDSESKRSKTEEKGKTFKRENLRHQKGRESVSSTVSHFNISSSKESRSRSSKERGREKVERKREKDKETLRDKPHDPEKKRGKGEEKTRENDREKRQRSTVFPSSKDEVKKERSTILEVSKREKISEEQRQKLERRKSKEKEKEKERGEKEKERGEKKEREKEKAKRKSREREDSSKEDIQRNQKDGKKEKKREGEAKKEEKEKKKRKHKEKSRTQDEDEESHEEGRRKLRLEKDEKENERELRRLKHGMDGKEETREERKIKEKEQRTESNRENVEKSGSVEEEKKVEESDDEYADDFEEDYEDDFVNVDDFEEPDGGGEEGEGRPGEHVDVVQFFSDSSEAESPPMTPFLENEAFSPGHSLSPSPALPLTRARTRKRIKPTRAKCCLTEEQRTALARLQRRARDLVKLVILESVSADLFELQPLSEYQLFMRQFGSRVACQASTQTETEDYSVCVEVETESEDRHSTATQWPMDWGAASLALIAASENHHTPASHALPSTSQLPAAPLMMGNTLTLIRFLTHAGPVVEALLVENVRSAEIGPTATIAGRPRLNGTPSLLSLAALPVAKTFHLPFSCPLIPAVVFSPTSPHIFATAHSPLPSDSSPESWVYLWNVYAPSTPTLSVHAYGAISSLAFGSADYLLLLGFTDGTVELFDTRFTVSSSSANDGLPTKIKGNTVEDRVGAPPSKPPSCPLVAHPSFSSRLHNPLSSPFHTAGQHYPPPTPHALSPTSAPSTALPSRTSSPFRVATPTPSRLSFFPAPVVGFALTGERHIGEGEDRGGEKEGEPTMSGMQTTSHRPPTLCALDEEGMITMYQVMAVPTDRANVALAGVGPSSTFVLFPTSMFNAISLTQAKHSSLLARSLVATTLCSLLTDSVTGFLVGTDEGDVICFQGHGVLAVPGVFSTESAEAIVSVDSSPFVHPLFAAASSSGVYLFTAEGAYPVLHWLAPQPIRKIAWSLTRADALFVLTNTGTLFVLVLAPSPKLRITTPPPSASSSLRRSSCSMIAEDEVSSSPNAPSPLTLVVFAAETLLPRASSFALNKDTLLLVRHPRDEGEGVVVESHSLSRNVVHCSQPVGNPALLQDSLSHFAHLAGIVKVVLQ